MKRFLLLLLVALLCLTLCSCDTLLKKAKSAVTGVEESKMPDDYLTSAENEDFSYDVYKEYIKITKYIAEDGNGEVIIPSAIEGKPVKVIGSLCFFETESAVTSVKIPSSVNEIEESAFYYADKLESIRIPDSVTVIGSRAFAWCKSLKSISFGSGVTEIPTYCFNQCESLESVIIPSKITKIGVRAFSYCASIKEFTVPSNIAELQDRAFDGCASLEFISINNPEITMGDQVLNGCEKVVVLAADGSNAKLYCAEKGIRWSTSKDIPAIVITPDESSVEDAVSE